MAGKQVDGWELSVFNMANIGFSLNKNIFSMNSLCFVHIGNYHLPVVVPTARRQGAAAPNKNIWG
jgi:hypothetical protein